MHLNIRFFFCSCCLGLVFVVIVFCVSHYAKQARLGFLIHLILLPQLKYLELEIFDTPQSQRQVLLVATFCRCVCMLCVCMQVPEVNVGYLPQLLRTFFFETGSLSEPTAS